jgi:hypothetical protein
MSPSLDTRTWGRASPMHVTDRRPVIALVLVGLVVAALVLPRLGLPAKTPPLTINNPTPYTLFVEASNGHDGGWEPVSIVHAQRTDTETDLVDVGHDWNLRFTSQGVVLTGYHVTRQQLAAKGWHYTVPNDVATKLAARGAPDSP